MNRTDLASQIADLLARGAHFYAGHSGGKDSQAMYAWLRTVVPAGRLHVVHADLGDIEHAGVKEHIRNNIDTELLIAQAVHADGSPKDFFSAVRARRASLDAKGRTDAPAFPSSAARFCTSDLKTGPIWKVIRAHSARVGARIVVNCVGIRAEESKSRARKISQRGTLNVNAKNTNGIREAYDWWPIAHWTTEEVFAEIAAAGQQPHPAYAMGNERLSCVFCIFASDNDLQNGYSQRPDLARALRRAGARDQHHHVCFTVPGGIAWASPWRLNDDLSL